VGTHKYHGVAAISAGIISLLIIAISWVQGLPIPIFLLFIGCLGYFVWKKNIGHYAIGLSLLNLFSVLTHPGHSAFFGVFFISQLGLIISLLGIGFEKHKMIPVIALELFIIQNVILWNAILSH